MVRMEDNEITRKVLTEHIYGNRRVGRPNYY